MRYKWSETWGRRGDYLESDISSTKKKYTRFMRHKKLTIASTLKIFLGFDSKNLKLDHEMKSNHFGSLSIGLLTLKQSA